MSGLAAGIRLAMFDKKVCIFERHRVPGGLNSYYERKGRKLDVGLHAMTNFARKGEGGRPLTKLLRQLRIPYEKLELSQQNHSRIAFPGKTLAFSNDPALLIREIAREFPDQAGNFARLLDLVKTADELNLANEYQSAKERVRGIITDEKLVEMIFCPLLIYGSAWENDMDFSQFVIMFKSIFLEGFCRPRNGVRTVIDLLLERYRHLGGRIDLGKGIKTIEVENGAAKGVTLDDGRFIAADRVLSSIGLPETLGILSDKHEAPPVGAMSFTETILFYDRKPSHFGIEDTIVFFNDEERYHYRKAPDYCDFRSAVICFPNNFGHDDFDEGVVRVTYIANSDKWHEMDRETYSLRKEAVLRESRALISRQFPGFEARLLFHDVFTPRTIRRFTGHLGGTVYGSPNKARNGRTGVGNLFVCGTDQGFLGIVGAMLSGISMANLHCLMGEEKA